MDVEAEVDLLVLPNLMEVEILEAVEEILALHFREVPMMEAEGVEVHLVLYSLMIFQTLEEVEVLAEEDRIHYQEEVALAAWVVLEAYFHVEVAYRDGVDQGEVGALVAFQADLVVEEVNHLHLKN